MRFPVSVEERFMDMQHLAVNGFSLPVRVGLNSKWVSVKACLHMEGVIAALPVDTLKEITAEDN